MAYATLLLHLLLCLAIITVMIDVRRNIGRLGDLGPGGRNEDLDQLRARLRGLSWRLPLLLALLTGALILGAFWSPVWRTSVIGQISLTGLALLAGLNLVLACARIQRQQWSPEGSVPGILKAGAGAIPAMALFVLTLFWVSGT